MAQTGRRLQQGAITSPLLSNLIAQKLDSRIIGASKAIDKTAKYTRYADDLAISFNKNFSDKFYNFNAQGELNLHNTISAFKFPDWFSFPLIGTLEVETVLYSIILFFLSWGSYFINAKKINSFFLNKDFFLST